MRIGKPAVVAALIGGVVLLVIAATTFVGGDPPQAGALAQPRSTDVPDGTVGADQLSTSIARAQQTLKDNPEDYVTWAQLGGAYVEQARITADPSYYPKSEGALQRSLDINRTTNDVGMTGMGALANARHEFAAGRDWAHEALAVNPASATAFGVLVDSLVQLGDYDGSTAALTSMLALRPGIPAFTRTSYNLELHGNIDGARNALNEALQGAYDPNDIAYLHTYLGLLSYSQGDLDGAAQEYALGLRQTPGEPTLLYGQAQVEAARGDQEAALADYQEVVNIRPLPTYLVEFGEYLLSIGMDDQAQQQFDLFETTQQLFAANGVTDSLGIAQLEANHGDPAKAVAAGESEYAARQNIDAADALAWALHSAGRDAEALPYAQQATGIGGNNALFLYHRGVIEQTLGMSTQARSTLDLALKTNPYFSPLYAPMAKEALAAVGGPL